MKKKQNKLSSLTLKKIGRWIRNLFLALFGFSIILVILARFLPIPITPLMVIRNVERISEDKPLRMKKEWVPIEEISPHIVNAVIASEDNKFMEHWGFDFDAIKTAAEKNKKRNNTAFGASTISQQTAKNLFLWPNRSWLRKGLEAYFTLLIELFWSKERIMEVYLNIIEMGDGIYGIERAANIYYDISASELNRSQAAIIAASLPSPRKYNPQNPTAYLKKRQSQILKVMRQMGK